MRYLRGRGRKGRKGRRKMRKRRERRESRERRGGEGERKNERGNGEECANRRGQAGRFQGTLGGASVLIPRDFGGMRTRSKLSDSQRAGLCPKRFVEKKETIE